MKVLIETSARHMHVSQEHLEVLFGAGAELTQIRELSQPGQYVSAQKVEVVGAKGSLIVTILGPVRAETQVEISLTEARKIGVAAPIRESGDIDGSAGCTLKGPAGEVTIEKGIIAAKRHIHMTPEDAEKVGVADKQEVSVKTDNNGRSVTFNEVVCRVNPTYGFAMHIDTDESNAAALSGEVYGEIIL